MLVPFAIEVDALIGEERWTPRELRDAHYAFLRAWKRIGLFVFEGQHLGDSASRSAFDTALEGSVMHGLWKRFVEQVPSVSGGDKWLGTLDEAALRRLTEVAKVCFAKGGTIDRLEESAKAVDLELLTIGSAGACRGFERGEHKAGAVIEPGEVVRRMWSERFAPLAAARTDKLKNISVVDPYSIERHITDLKEGLTRFLSLLSETAVSRKNVSVYAKWPYRNNQRIARTEIIQSLQALRVHGHLGRIGSLTVILGNTAEQYPRERFIMFGEKYVWDIGHVLELFDADIVTKTHTASFKTWELAESYGAWLGRLQAYERLAIW